MSRRLTFQFHLDHLVDGSEYEDRLSDREFFRQEIVAEAKRWLTDRVSDS